MQTKLLYDRVLSVVMLVTLLLSLTGCDAGGFVQLPDFLGLGRSATPLVTSGPPPVSSETPLGQTATPQQDSSNPVVTTAAPDATASPAAFPSTLTLWVPPEFDPAGGTPAGDLLNARLQEFSQQYGGVEVRVRVKATSGAGGLLESLTASAAAAPEVLPSVIALSRTDLEVAALKGLVFPLDGTSTTIDQTDWYNYARQLAMVQGATFALPFAGDALVLAYRPTKVIGPPADWDTILRLSQPMAFPAGDTQSLFVLSLYLSLDGAVEDAQRRPMLQPEILSQVLQLFSDGEERGIFPTWLSQYETHAQVYQAYRDGRVNATTTWVSSYLSALSADTAAVAIPSMDDTSLALATGWGWAVSDPDPTRRVMSIRLAEFLSDGAFLAQWTEAAGYLPPRPSALAAWTNQGFKTLLSPVAVSAQARPSVDQLASLGPVLKEATLKVLQKESDATQAAQAAAERLAEPETK